MGFIREFKEFAMRGSVVDLAVGVIIGGAFGKIVTSFVNDVLMPPIGILLGGVDFKSYALTLKDAVMDGNKVLKPAIMFNVGSFIQSIVDFLIIAVAIFALIKFVNRFKRKDEPPAEVPPEPSEEVKLLGEIRDLLKRQ